MTDDQTDPKTEDTDAAPKGAHPDVQSDPAEGGSASDWTGEGGATQHGPATNEDAE